MKLPLLLLAAALLALSALPASSETDATPERLQILTTFAPIDSFTRNVVGDAADVVVLLPSGVGPHDYAITPGDLRKIADSDVVILNGLGAEFWLTQMLENPEKSDLLIIDTSNGIDPITGTTEIAVTPDPDSKGHSHSHSHAHSHSHSHSHGHAHSEGDPNPHIWLDPVLAMQQVETIRDALVARDPANADIYQANTAAYLETLAALDADFRKAIETLPNRKLLTFHDAFVYFADRYGFELVGVFQPFPGREPTPRYLQQLRDAIQQHDVKVLFAEPQYEPRLMRSLADDLGIPVAVLDPLEVGTSSADFYESTMRQNLATLQQSLHGDSSPAGN